MNSCKEHRENVTLLAIDELPDGRAESLQSHLAGCPDCRDYLQSMRIVSRHLVQAATQEPGANLPARFHQRFRERVRAEALPRPQRLRTAWLADWLTPFRVSMAGAAIGIVFIAALWSDRSWINRQNHIAAPPSKPADATLPETGVPPPTLMAMTRAWCDSFDALDALLARQEKQLAPNDPLSTASGRPVAF